MNGTYYPNPTFPNNMNGYDNSMEEVSSNQVNNDEQSYIECHGKGCPLCKSTGWITIGGAGLVHPNVLRNCGYDPNIWSGFAFGFGAERIAMLKYGIKDIRTFYNLDLREVENFDRKDGEV